MIFIIALTFLILLATFCVRKHQTYKLTDHIPGPKPLPFVGNMLELGTNLEGLFHNFNRLIRKYGKVVRLCIGTQNGVLVADPRYVSQILVATDRCFKGELVDFAKPLIGEGLIWSSGDAWARQRKILNPAFSKKYLKKYIAVINESAEKLLEQLELHAQRNYGDITDYVYCCTLNSICKAAMNVDVTENMHYHNYVFQLLDLIFKRFVSPLKHSDFLYRFTADYRKAVSCTKAIDEFVRNAIKKRKEEYQRGPSLSILDDIFRLTGEDILTDQELLDQVKTFVFAGSDTVGTALNFALFELGRHPEVQEKVFEEVDAILNENVKFEDLRQLKYTECIIKEILRMYSPAAFFPRLLDKDIYLDDLLLPARTTAFIYLRGVHMSADVYPDPEKFDPDRFLPEKCADRQPYEFVPFSTGARACIGQKFAMMEAKLVLAKVVRSFEISALPGHEVKLLPAGVLKSSSGLPVKFRLRKS